MDKAAQPKATLYLNMILGDFEPVEIVKRSIDSVKDGVDGMYITVTYKDKEPTSEAPLVKLLQEYKANISYYKWNYNFADARNFALSKVPRGKDIFIYWQDADDVLRGVEHLHRVADEMLIYQQVAIFFVYWYNVDVDKDGTIREVLVEHKRERIIKNDDTFKWVGDLHETLIEQKQENLIRHERPECTVVHLADKEREDDTLSRNIQILEESAKKEQHRDPRTLLYLARAYLDKAKLTEMPQRKINLDLALNLFHEYLEGSGRPGQEHYIEGSGWREERATAWGHVGEIAVLSGHPEVAVQAYQSAIDEAPEFPSYYIDLAMCYTSLGEFKKARQWLNIGAATPMPKTTILVLPRDMKTRALEVSWHLNLHEGKMDWALEDAKKLAEIMRDDKFAQDRLAETQKSWEFNKACQSMVYLGKYLEQNKEKDKIQHLVQAMPNDMKREKFAAEMRHIYLPPKIWEKNEIAILCGPGFEEWSPKSIQTGLGGSEEAVVYLSQELTKLGWKVTVYANPGKEEGLYDDVEYKVWHDLNPRDEFNVLILWRGIGFTDVNPKAKFTMLWMHDVPNNPDFTEERLEKVDKIAVLSDYHKSLFRMAKDGAFAEIPADKFFLTSNGIPKMPEKEWEGNPKRMVYMSSIDRGLVYLLTNWAKIRKEVPDAELHVFYGFKVFDAIHRDNPAKVAWKAKVMKMMKQDGITFHDRVGHEALNYEISKSGIWAYPTDFTEISCISAMKAQALGAVPVVTDFAALSETVKNGARVDVDITTEEGQEKYFATLIDMLKNPEKQAEIRKNMVPWARKYFLWEDVARLWNELFQVKLQNPEKKHQLGTKPGGDK